MENPLGFYMESARISYVAEESRGSRQTAARVVAAKEETFAELIFDSGKREDIDSICYELPFRPEPRTRYYWKVTVWDDAGDVCESEPGKACLSHRPFPSRSIRYSVRRSGWKNR